VDTLYFDNNATTFLDPLVALRMQELFALKLANPASQHKPGRAALRILEQAKSELLDALDAPADGMDTAQVLLTSGGTEANNLAIFGLSLGNSLNAPQRSVLVASIEHPSILEAAAQLSSSLTLIPVDPLGRVCLEKLEELLATSPTPISVVSVMLGNNETGVIQDLKAICDLAHRYGTLVHSDVVQAAGKIPFSMRETGVDAISLTAHKIHGPVGIGALIVRHGLKIHPRLFGGGQQLEIRPGTEPVVLADAFATALKLSLAAVNNGDYRNLATLRQEFEQRVMEELGDVQIISSGGARLPHTSNIAFLGVDRQALLIALDLCGVSCSTGSACASGSGRPSHVLQAMKLPEPVVGGSLRFSFSRFTTPQEFDMGAEKLIRTVLKLRR
jgi:cysteine desulfurase